MKNTQISRILGDMWKNATEDEKRPYVEKEKAEREEYKVAMAKWREEFDAKQEAERKAQQMAYNAPPPTTMEPPRNTFYADPYSYPPVAAQPHMHPHYPYGEYILLLEGFLVLALDKSLRLTLVNWYGHILQVTRRDRTPSRRTASNQ